VWAGQLVVTTSSNSESNAEHSFVVVPDGKLIPEGIRHITTPATLTTQIPFVVELQPPADAGTQLQWRISVEKNHYGKVEVLSAFNGTASDKNNFVWQSATLDDNIRERHRLLFRPKLSRHQPVIYKRGMGPKNQRRPYGGGTRDIDDDVYNPRLTYDVHLDILRHGAVIESHDARLRMDNKDMIRQEYINHFGIKRYGRGGDGVLPVPRRDEITDIPAKPKNILGAPLSESSYGLMVNDGVMDLIVQIADLYARQQALYRQNPLRNLRKENLPVPDNKLWISGGWRNPERNEWFSNALNGIHQRGGAADIIINEPPGHINNAISFWMLWNALESKTHNIAAFWQLETNGRPMRTAEFKEDIEPANGIPDAFDKADHLHINVHYDTAVDEQ
jgi:hypothetical protein